MSALVVLLSRHALQVGEQTPRKIASVTRHSDEVLPFKLRQDAGLGDAIANMQWQTITDAKVKDRWERSICRGHQ